MVFAYSIVLLGLWVLIMVDGHWVFEICWVNGKAFFFSSSSQNLRKERERLLGRGMKERRDVTDVTNRLRIRTEMVSF